LQRTRLYQTRTLAVKSVLANLSIADVFVNLFIENCLVLCPALWTLCEALSVGRLERGLHWSVAQARTLKLEEQTVDTFQLLEQTE